MLGKHYIEHFRIVFSVLEFPTFQLATYKVILVDISYLFNGSELIKKLWGVGLELLDMGIFD